MRLSVLCNLGEVFRLPAMSLWLVLAAVAHTQPFTMDWFTIDGGGGGTSTGGVSSLNGAFGLPDANAQPMTGGNFELVGGFWSLFAMQTSGAPLLTVTSVRNSSSPRFRGRRRPPASCFGKIPTSTQRTGWHPANHV